MKNEKLIRTAINHFEVAARVLGKLQNEKPRVPRLVNAQLNKLYSARRDLIKEIENSQT